MARRTIDKRLSDLAERHRQRHAPLAVIDISGMDEHAAQVAIVERRMALEASGSTGPLVVLGRQLNTIGLNKPGDMTDATQDF